MGHMPTLRRTPALVLALFVASTCVWTTCHAGAGDDPAPSPEPRQVHRGADAPARAEAPALPDVGPEPLVGGLASLDALGAAVVAALNAGDPAALAALTVTRDEYTGRLFPALAMHPGAEALGRELLWDMHARQSRDDMLRALAHHGRADLRYVRLEPRGRLVRAGVVFHERPRLVVVDPAGVERGLVLLASAVEHEATGTFKLLGYRDHQ